MKLVAITAGRKLGNTEICVKEALMAAEELGAEVQMINLHDCNIKPCTGCEVCTMMMAKGERPKCIHKDKDDMDKIMDIALNANGLIIGAPTYEMQPAALYNVFANRFIPYETSFLAEIGAIEHAPKRVAGLIASGGSTLAWMNMALPSLYISMLTQSVKIVDQLLATGVGRPGHVLLKEDTLAKARKMGQNLVEAMKTPYEQVKYLGEDQGLCPVCHSNLIYKGQARWDGEHYAVECAVCAAGGNIQVNEKGDVAFVVDEKSKRTTRMDDKTRNDHLYEIKKHMKEFFSNIETVQARLGKYRDYKVRGLE
ncbi:flavodoxin family protein [Sporomusa sp.]|uniref:flavodoxin family protein n=1 Tax=Sporomusa sp. TaxID=2078658 RepID=UPI002D02F04A|nr:NAD(P)H-dependent oxidoreductase [Sporomusa sp.]HWR45501.1 NAD(P)H-dependent oxidoreductase [Sporomusa sp.]